MITTFIMNLFFGCLNALLSLTPSYSLPTFSSPIGDLGGYASQLSAVLPLDTIALIAISGIVLKIIMSGWDLLVFGYHQFWGSN